MKKIVLLLIAALLLCAFAAAETVETPDYALTLPEGFVPVSETEMEGYREASARDAGGRYEGEALMALRDGEAITVVEGSTDYAETREAAEALVAEYADYVAGFESVEPQYVEGRRPRIRHGAGVSGRQGDLAVSAGGGWTALYADLHGRIRGRDARHAGEPDFRRRGNAADKRRALRRAGGVRHPRGLMAAPHCLQSVSYTYIY